MSNVRSDPAFDPRILPQRDAGTPLEQYGGRGLYHLLLSMATAPKQPPKLPAAPAIRRPSR